MAEESVTLHVHLASGSPPWQHLHTHPGFLSHWKSPLALLHCISSQVQEGVFVINGAHTQFTNSITDSIAEDKIGALALTLESLFLCPQLGDACFVQCQAYLLCTHLFPGHLMKTHVPDCGFENRGTTESDSLHSSIFS